MEKSNGSCNGWEPCRWLMNACWDGCALCTQWASCGSKPEKAKLALGLSILSEQAFRKWRRYNNFKHRKKHQVWHTNKQNDINLISSVKHLSLHVMKELTPTMPEVKLYPKYLCPLVAGCSVHCHPKDQKTQSPKNCLLSRFNLSCPGHGCSHHRLLEELVWEVCCCGLCQQKQTASGYKWHHWGWRLVSGVRFFFSIWHSGSTVSCKLGC